MAFLENPDLCSFEEYERHRGDRVIEHALEEKALYMYMMRLDSGEEGVNMAAKQPTRIKEIIRTSGLIAVRLEFLDDDLFPELDSTECIQNGFIVEDDIGRFVMHETEDEYPVTEAYMKEYDDGFTHDLLRTTRTLALKT